MEIVEYSSADCWITEYEKVHPFLYGLWNLFYRYLDLLYGIPLFLCWQLMTGTIHANSTLQLAYPIIRLCGTGIFSNLLTVENITLQIYRIFVPLGQRQLMRRKEPLYFQFRWLIVFYSPCNLFLVHYCIEMVLSESLDLWSYEWQKQLLWLLKS